MDTTIISAIIACFGVIVSVTITYFSNKKQFRTELEKIELNSEQNYATKLVDKRLEFYPFLYEEISRMAKKIKRIVKGMPDEKVTLSEIISFQKEYDRLNSKYAVVFSSVSSSNSYKLRMQLIEIIKKCKNPKLNEEIPLVLLETLSELLRKLEFSLKQDLGVYIVEFQDAKRELALKDYDDVIKQREKKRKKE